MNLTSIRPRARIPRFGNHHAVLRALHLLGPGHHAEIHVESAYRSMCMTMDLKPRPMSDLLAKLEQGCGVDIIDLGSHQTIRLTSVGLERLQQLEGVTAPTPVDPPKSALPRDRTPDFCPAAAMTLRPPAIRAGAQDHLQHPSRIGGQVVPYTPHP